MPDFDFKQGVSMKKFALTTALLLISASAYAGSYNIEGVTLNVQDGCRCASCVSVNAPGYGSYNGKALSAKRSAKAHKFHKTKPGLLRPPRPMPLRWRRRRPLTRHRQNCRSPRRRRRL
jgi:hypothetical protein